MEIVFRRSTEVSRDVCIKKKLLKVLNCNSYTQTNIMGSDVKKNGGFSLGRH